MPSFTSDLLRPTIVVLYPSVLGLRGGSRSHLPYVQEWRSGAAVQCYG